MSEVEYSGPADGERSSEPTQETREEEAPIAPVTPDHTSATTTQPQITVYGDTARLRFVANVPDVTFHLFTRAATATAGGSAVEARGYDAICTAPCEASLLLGTHTLALSMPRHKTKEARAPISIDGPSVLRGTFTSRRKLRLGAIIGSLVGSA